MESWAGLTSGQMCLGWVNVRNGLGCGVLLRQEGTGKGLWALRGWGLSLLGDRAPCQCPVLALSLPCLPHTEFFLLRAEVILGNILKKKGWRYSMAAPALPGSCNPSEEFPLLVLLAQAAPRSHRSIPILPAPGESAALGFGVCWEQPLGSPPAPLLPSPSGVGTSALLGIRDSGL